VRLKDAQQPRPCGGEAPAPRPRIGRIQRCDACRYGRTTEYATYFGALSALPCFAPDPSKAATPLNFGGPKVQCANPVWPPNGPRKQNAHEGVSQVRVIIGCGGRICSRPLKASERSGRQSVEPEGFMCEPKEAPADVKRACQNGRPFLRLRGPDLNRRPSGYEFTKAGFRSPSQHAGITQKPQT
jgi:hypothetical protein